MNSSYEKIRRLIGERLSVIIKLPDAIFENAIVETIIFQAINGKSDLTVRGRVYANNVKADLKTVDFNFFSIDNWQKDAEFRFNIFQDIAYENVLSKIEKSTTKFSDVADFSLGITPYDKYRGHSEETIKNRAFHSLTKLTSTYKPLISGKNIKMYQIDETPEEYINYGDWLGAQREERFFTQPRLLIRQIVSGKPLHISCGYTEAKLYFTQIGFSIIAKNNCQDYTNFVLLAILNSKLLNFYHNNRFLDTEKTVFQKILIANCKNFPLPKIKKSSKEIIEKIVGEIIKGKSIGISTVELENQLDIIICRLYNLTYYEAKLIIPAISVREDEYDQFEAIEIHVLNY